MIYGAGNDNDVIDGGTGFDTLKVTQATSTSNDNINVALAGGSLTNVGGTSVQNVENAELDLGAGTDTLNYGGTGRKSVVQGKRESVRVALDGRRPSKKNNKNRDTEVVSMKITQRIRSQL